MKKGLEKLINLGYEVIENNLYNLILKRVNKVIKFDKYNKRLIIFNEYEDVESFFPEEIRAIHEICEKYEIC